MSVQARLPAADQPVHVVRFYDYDDELARSVGDDLGRALSDNAAAVVVATHVHRDAIEARMTAVGADVAAAAAGGRYLALDAASTMDRFLIGDWPDPASFEQVIGGVIRRAAAAGRPVRVFGEMVALLWNAGQVGTAIEVESLWNELAGLVPFSLTCGYMAASAFGDEHADALEIMCGLHTGVAGHVPAGTGTVPGTARRATRAFALSQSAPHEARLFVTSTLRQWGDIALTPDAEIIIGELAANVFVHARTGFSVALSQTEDSVRIAVRDSGPVPGPHHDPWPAAAQGHGLGVVAAVSSRWAAERGPAGKTVWAELERA
jgi:hypothetical protein